MVEVARAAQLVPHTTVSMTLVNPLSLAEVVEGKADTTITTEHTAVVVYLVPEAEVAVVELPRAKVEMAAHGVLMRQEMT